LCETIDFELKGIHNDYDINYRMDSSLSMEHARMAMKTSFDFLLRFMESVP